jgi:hypothetical protein
VSTGHAPKARFEARLLDGLDEPVRRYFVHAPFFEAVVLELTSAGGTW